MTESSVAIAAGHAPSRRREEIAAAVQRHGALAVLVLVVVVFSFVFPSFGTVTNLTNILVDQSFLAIVALGMTFVIISGGIDLSVGSVFALGGVVAAWGSQHGFLVGLGAPLLLCGGIGLINGVLIARAGMAPFIVTLAALLGARGLMRAISSEGSETYLVKSKPFAHFGSGSFLGLGYPVWLAAVLVVVGMVVLARTRFGRAVYAVGGSEDAAALMGIAVRRTKVGVYVMSGLLAGLAGAINAAKLGSGVTVLGSGMELNAIAAVVIGGTLLTGGAGTIAGTIAGVLLLGVIQNLINQVGNLNSNWQQVISGAFLALVVVAQTYLVKLRRVN